MVGLAWVVPNFPIGLGRSYFPIGLRNPMNNNSDGFAIASAMNVENVVLLAERAIVSGRRANDHCG